MLILGGTYMMGSDDPQLGPASRPAHEVTVPTFEITMTEITMSQYQACIDAGICTEQIIDDVECNTDPVSEANHPVNCVNWYQAEDFCTWAGGRLPSDAEWEYAARSGGRDVYYPWGNDWPQECVHANFNYCHPGDSPACSYPRGNTDNGLCDMTGNISELIKDNYHNTYVGAPTDGSAWIEPGSTSVVVRGGYWRSQAFFLSHYRRGGIGVSNSGEGLGFRCARDVP